MIKRFLLLFTCALLFSGFCQGQNLNGQARFQSPYTYIYRVSDQQAQQIFRSGPQVVEPAFFHTLVDSFAVSQGFNKKLRQGHYLFLHSQGPDLVYNLQTYASFSSRIVAAKGLAGVLVQDSLGNMLPDAQVQLNNSKAVYDPALGLYRLKQSPAKGVLTVRRQGFTQMEKIGLETEDTRGLLGKISSAPPLRFLLRPFVSAWVSLKQGYPQGWVRRVWALFDASYRREKASYRGYLVTNKPMYRPGDTVRYKAFVVGKTGKPVDDQVLLQLSGPGLPAKSLGTLQPYRKGGYQGYFVLHDSLKLKLDYSYRVSLLETKRRRLYVSNSFAYEDYELQENQYRFALALDEHATGQENSLLLRGTNANGLNLLDTRVEVAVVTRNVRQSQEPALFIPDTLWTHQQPLDSRGETRISIPSKVFPRASVDYTVTATFRSASNERTILSENARYQFTRGHLKLSLLQDSLRVQYLEAGRQKVRKAAFRVYNGEYDELQAFQLQLPATLPLHALAASYEVSSGDLEAELDLEKEDALVSLQAFREKDSLYLALQNPRRLPYWYFVYRAEKLLTRGQGKEARLLLEQPARGNKPYFVVVQYLWAGEMQQLREELPLRRHMMHIDLQAPQVVYPGQQTQVKISVKDAAGKPLADADLTAFAITSKFKDLYLPGLPTWDRYKSQKPFRKRIRQEPELAGRKLMNWDYWKRRLGLDSMAYYHFLYPRDGLFTQYARTRDRLTQVSPFVVDSGRVVPVHVVYLDEVPVYFSRTDVLPPYAFAADSGYHRLKLRTADKLITLDSVYFRHQHRLLLSADITGPQQSYARAAGKGVLSDAEKGFLYKHLFQVQHPGSDTMAYLKQGQRLLLLRSNHATRPLYYSRAPKTTLLAGPFSAGAMQYVRLDHFTTAFRMEPGYRYTFSPQLLKMQEWKLADGKILLPPWNKQERLPDLLQQQALTEQKIQEDWQALQQKHFLERIYARNTSNAREPGKGRLGWSLGADIRQQVRLVLLHQAGSPDSLRVYPRESAVLHQLQPGAYILTLAFTDSTQAVARVLVKAHGQTQLHLTRSDVKPASAESRYLLQLVAGRIGQLKVAAARQAQAEKKWLQTTREVPFTFINGIGQYSHYVSGQVTDLADASPLPGVQVLLKATNIGATTDANGRYGIYVPEDGTLVFQFIGYHTKEVAVSGKKTLQVQLEPSMNMLEEVVVVGYGEEQKRNVTGAVSLLQGRVAGVSVRGAGALKTEGARPLLIVDGLPFSGTLSDLEASTIVSSKTLKPEEARALYGGAGAAGVILVTTRKGSFAAPSEEQEPHGQNSIRQHFSDYAFWQPQLKTNQQGEASFQAVFPDDITRWDTYVLGMDGEKRSGIYTASINAFKAMMATLHLPGFLVEEDQALVTGKALNYLTDTATVTTAFEVDGKTRKTARKLLDKSFTDTLRIKAAGQAGDSISLQYSLRRETGFSDGEKRYLPVYRRGLEEKPGRFLQLHSDTTLTLHFDPSKGPVRLQSQGDLFQVLLDEIGQLHRYPYWCSEQAASKLIALLLEKQIRHNLQQPFEQEQAIRKLIRHLEKSQLSKGAWAWWQQGPAHTWITTHVVQALVMAKKAGYPVHYQEQNLVSYLVYQLSQVSAPEAIQALEALHLLEAKVDYRQHVQELEKNKKLPLEQKLRLTRLRQGLQLPAPLDTLQRHQQKTMTGGLYWGKAQNSLFNNHISNTLLAYQVLRQAGGHAEELARIRAFLLSERHTGHWRNTYESANVLATLLPDLLQKQKEQPAGLSQAVRFSGALQFAPEQPAVDTTFEASAPLVISKQGKLPLYLSAYQTVWNKTPRPVTRDFVVKSSFKGIKEGTALKAGNPVEMQVEVEAKADAEYVMIEVPIPAGCSYETKTGKGGYEVHREYYRNKVSIFCGRLPKGRHSFTIRLLPRYPGVYSLNPARAELMYFPAFYGRNEIRQVRVR